MTTPQEKPDAPPPSLVPAEVERARKEDPAFSDDFARARAKAKGEADAQATREAIARFEERARAGRPRPAPVDPYKRIGAR